MNRQTENNITRLKNQLKSKWRLELIGGVASMIGINHSYDQLQRLVWHYEHDTPCEILECNEEVLVEIAKKLA